MISSAMPKYAPGPADFPPQNAATIKLTHYRFFAADLTKAQARYRATRLGGIPAGSLEVLGRLKVGRLKVGRLVKNSFSQRRPGSHRPEWRSWCCNRLLVRVRPSNRYRAGRGARCSGR